MKKMLFTLALVLTASFAFANNTNQSELSTNLDKNATTYSINSTELKDNLFGTCTVTATFYNSEGEVTGTKIHTFYNVATESDCDAWAAAVRLHYAMQ